MHLVLRQILVSFWGYTRISAKSSLAFRGDLVGYFVQSGSLLVLFLIANSAGVPTSEGDGRQIEYFFVCTVFFIACGVSPRGQFAGDIRAGIVLLRDVLPSNTISRCAGEFLGARIVPSTFAVVALFLVLVSGSVESTVSISVRFLWLFAFLPFSLMAVILFDHVISFLAFVSPFHQGVGELKAGFYLLSCGIIFPLDQLPVSVQFVAGLTPFPAAVFAPADLISGELPVEMTEAVATVTSLLLWVAVTLPFAIWLDWFRRQAHIGYEA